jgi:UTP--glucose-1-phosphate uridylyltransferase
LIGLDSRSDICRRMIGEFEASGAEAVIAFQEVPRAEVVHYGIAKPRGPAGEVFELEDLVEKPTVEDSPSCLAIAARYVCRPTIFGRLQRIAPGKGEEIQLTDALRLAIQEGDRVLGVRLAPGERRYDVGNFQAYFEAFIECAAADPQYGPPLRQFLRGLLGDGEAPRCS